jgi:hypothetical protein
MRNTIQDLNIRSRPWSSFGMSALPNNASYGLGCDYTRDIQQKQTQPTNSYAQPTHPGVSPTQPFDTDPYTDRIKPK